MVDQFGDIYSVAPVLPQCYDSADVNASTTLAAHQRVDVQLCYPVMTGALPQRLKGTRSLNRLTFSVPSDSIVGTWQGT
jgi:hypothetical protein